MLSARLTINFTTCPTPVIPYWLIFVGFTFNVLISMLSLYGVGNVFKHLFLGRKLKDGSGPKTGCLGVLVQLLGLCWATFSLYFQLYVDFSAFYDIFSHMDKLSKPDFLDSMNCVGLTYLNSPNLKGVMIYYFMGAYKASKYAHSKALYYISRPIFLGQVVAGALFGITFISHIAPGLAAYLWIYGPFVGIIMKLLQVTRRQKATEKFRHLNMQDVEDAIEIKPSAVAPASTTVTVAGAVAKPNGEPEEGEREDCCWRWRGLLELMGGIITGTSVITVFIILGSSVARWYETLPYHYLKAFTTTITERSTDAYLEYTRENMKRQISALIYAL